MKSNPAHLASQPLAPHLVDAPANVDNEGTEPEFKPLSAQEALAWRQRNPMASPWRVLWLQAVVGSLLALVVGLVSGQFRLAASLAWGAVAVVVPGLVFARALSRQAKRLSQPGAALLGLFVWELVKIVLTVVLLVAAPKVVFELSWLALVAGFVVTMKVYWLAMALGWWQRKSAPNFF